MIITLLFAEFLIPQFSIYVLHRDHLLNVKLYGPVNFPGMPQNTKKLTFAIENKDKAISLEDINIIIDTPEKIIEVSVSADEGIFEYQISKGMKATIYVNGQKTSNIPSNHRNIKIRKIFPGSLFGLEIYTDTSQEGIEFAPRTGINSGKINYEIEYSYRYLGTTVRRKLQKEFVGGNL